MFCSSNQADKRRRRESFGVALSILVWLVKLYDRKTAANIPVAKLITTPKYDNRIKVAAKADRYSKLAWHYKGSAFYSYTDVIEYVKEHIFKIDYSRAKI